MTQGTDAPIEATAIRTRELVRAVQEAGMGSIDLQFSDVLGAVKTVTIPSAQLAAAVEHGVWFDGSSVEGRARSAESDMYLEPQPATYAVLPWSGGKSARLICQARTPDGQPYPGDPRGVLARAVEHAREMGFAYHVGPEIEFFLLQRSGDGSVAGLEHDRGGYFDFASDQAVALRDDIVAQLHAMGVVVNSTHHEVAASQHEIDLDSTDVVAAADAVVTCRYVAKAVAQQASAIATFMPKPFADESGSGMHVHQSLRDLTSGDNAFFDRAGEYSLSETAKQFIAGQLYHARAMCAVLSPSINSYKRLVRGFEAPIFISWARTNRGALIRVPHVSRPDVTRIELRSPDPSCNPYLAFAVMLECGLDGIRRRLPLPPPVEESLYGFDAEELARRDVGVLPDNLKDALELCAADDVVRRALGDYLMERFLEAKELEWRDYRAQVTPWELERYLEPA